MKFFLTVLIIPHIFLSFVSDCSAISLADVFYSQRRCDFERRKFCDLRNANLSGRVLKNASTWGMNLGNADFSNADLSKALLINANLVGANLQNANLSSASLAGANLTGANLTGAKFDEDTILCNTTRPDGKRIFLNCKGRNTILGDADLEKLKLNGIDFSNSVLYRASFAYSSLRGANLSFAELNSVNFTGADLTGANMKEVGINHITKFCNTKMPNGGILFNNCQGSNLRSVSMKGFDLSGVNFKEADLTGADLRGAKLDAANFERANLTGVKLNGSELAEANLSGAVLCRTTLSDCRGSDYLNLNKIIGDAIFTYTNELSLIRGRHYSAYAIDSDVEGNIFVGNYRKNEILILDENLHKKFLMKDIPTPHGITIDNSGAIYVTTFIHRRVLKFNKKFQPIPDWDLNLRESGLLKEPIAITNDELGNVYVGDYKGNIFKVSSEGKMIAVFEKKDQPNMYHGLSVLNKKLYAAARSNHLMPGQGKIRVFDLEGKYIKDFESPKGGLDPLAIEVMSDKYFLVPNFWKEQLFLFYIYNEAGKIVGYFGETGKENGQFLSPTNLAYSPKGFIYVVEDRSNRIQKIKLKNFETKIR